MNAAFLLVTTAWIAGADAPPPPPPPAAAPVYSAGTGAYGGGCGCSSGCGCTSGCGCESEGLLSKLKGLFHRNDCDCGCESEGFLSRFKGGLHKSECGCGNTCGTGCGNACGTGCGNACGTGCGNTCDTGCSSFGGRFREKLRGLFNRGDCGCDTGCGTCGGCAGGGCAPITTVPLKPEPLGKPKEEPKKLPSGDQPIKPGRVQLIPQPLNSPDLDIAPTSGKSPF